MRINQLMIEVTRKCNMKCDHCLRGRAQNLSMNIEYIEKFLPQISRIDSLGFTGGEPTLPDGLKVINATRKIIAKNNIEIGTFWIVTNGKRWTSDIGPTIRKMRSLCKCDQPTIEISRDQFHSADRVQIERFEWELKKYKSKNPDGIMAQHFDVMKREERLDDSMIMKGGRSVVTGVGEKGYTWRPAKMNFVIDKEMVCGSQLYLNCKGNLIWGCDWSYYKQDDPRNIVCSVHDDFKTVAYSFAEKKGMIS